MTRRPRSRLSAGIGGEHGWYSFPLAWSVRGWLDRIFGGVGLRRGRRDPQALHKGDALDWGRVEEVDEDPAGRRLLRLRAEMRVPGDAWLEWRIEPVGTGSHLTQRAIFSPRGLAGRAYWYGLVPFHGLIFPRLAEALAELVGADGVLHLRLGQMPQQRLLAAARVEDAVDRLARAGLESVDHAHRPQHQPVQVARLDQRDLVQGQFR